MDILKRALQMVQRRRVIPSINRCRLESVLSKDNTQIVKKEGFIQGFAAQPIIQYGVVSKKQNCGKCPYRINVHNQDYCLEKENISRYLENG